MVTLDLENNYHIKSLTINNLKSIESLNLKCSDYYLLHDGVLPSKKDALEIFSSLPPGKSYEDKFVLGIYKSRDELIGIIEIVRDFPVIGEWMLGLLFIEPDERHHGLGRRVHEALVQWAITLGSRSFRIGVIKENHKGKKFWSDLGYLQIKEMAMDLTKKAHIIDVMTLQIANNKC
jgi:GNAT superfamily N-acetyltransferase